MPSLLKTLVKLAAVALVALLVVEIGLRIVFAFKVGPSIFLRGFKEERVIADGYTKYKPHQKRYDTNPDTGESFSVSINSRGFRGADFELEKPAGAKRVLTLGASSTFGFRDQDHETYPFLLGEILAEECRSTEFEVINLGIPHLESKHILALFRKEGLELEPDIVTFYEGINDSASKGISATRTANEVKRRASLWPRAVRWYRFLREATVLVGLASKLLESPAKSNAGTVVEFEQHARAKSDYLLGNVEEIRRECRQAGIDLVVANQQATSLSLSRDELRSTSYAAEIELIREKEERAELSDNELFLLIHSELMEDLEQWALREDVPFVDVIEELDGARDTLVSWVHLNVQGNERVARALADVILARACPAPESVPAASRL